VGVVVVGAEVAAFLALVELLLLVLEATGLLLFPAFA
jgi:hypothetical protein